MYAYSEYGIIGGLHYGYVYICYYSLIILYIYNVYIYVMYICVIHVCL